MEHAVDLSVSRVVRILDFISRPAAPFYEMQVAAAIREVCLPMLSNPKVTQMADRCGNLVYRFWNSPNPSLPSLILASHMDHPGFDPLEADGSRITAKIMGKLPSGDELIGTPIRMIDPDKEYMGYVESFTDKTRQNVFFRLDSDYSGRISDAFAVPEMVRFETRPPFAHGRAMDDLVGCAIQIAVMEQVVSLDLPVDLMIVFHRAEEVGFIGAIGACELKTVPLHSIVVSLEASKYLEGAVPGEGIVIRTGDRMYQFDPNAEALLNAAAGAANIKGVKTQRRRMDGGVCEASCYHAFGYEATGLAVPLINYHNHGEGSVEPESVHLADLKAGVDLLIEAAGMLPQIKYVSRTAFTDLLKKKYQESLPRVATRSVI